MSAAAYDLDFNLWAKEQARALAERRFEDLDLAHLVEEVEDLGKPERHALKSDIIIVMAHLLKWQFQPGRRSGSWFDRIIEHRERILWLLGEYPSFKPSVEDVTIASYKDALKLAMKQTHLPRNAFPPECPYTFEDLFAIEIEDPT